MLNPGPNFSGKHGKVIERFFFGPASLAWPAFNTAHSEPFAVIAANIISYASRYSILM